jgi:adaptor protein crk, putative (fragment)
MRWQPILTHTTEEGRLTCLKKDSTLIISFVSLFCIKSWYFGDLNRKEAENLLDVEDKIGVFLVRNSGTIPGDLVLSVK